MTKLEAILIEVENALNTLAPLFVPEMQLTFIARLPGNDEADILVSNDDFHELVRLIERAENRAEAK